MKKNPGEDPEYTEAEYNPPYNHRHRRNRHYCRWEECQAGNLHHHDPPSVHSCSQPSTRPCRKNHQDTRCFPPERRNSGSWKTMKRNYSNCCQRYNNKMPCTLWDQQGYMQVPMCIFVHWRNTHCIPASMPTHSQVPRSTIHHCTLPFLRCW